MSEEDWGGGGRRHSPLHQPIPEASSTKSYDNFSNRKDDDNNDNDDARDMAVAELILNIDAYANNTPQPDTDDPPHPINKRMEADRDSCHQRNQ